MMRLCELYQDRINEYSLNTYKKVLSGGWDLPQDLINYLKQNGFHLEGEGSYSHVYSHSQDNIVVKINTHQFNPAYVKFVEFCYKNKGNPHLPKTGKVRTYDNNGKKYFVLIIERLQPLGNPYVTDVLRDLAMLYRHKGLNSLSTQDLNKFWKDEKRYRPSGFSLTQNDAKQIKDMAELLVKCMQAGLRQFIVDINANNVMQRDSTYVLADPFCE